MPTARQIRDLITETAPGTVWPSVPRKVRDEICGYAALLAVHRLYKMGYARWPS